MTPVSLKLLLPGPSVHSVCHTTLSLHPCCNGGDLFLRVLLTWKVSACLAERHSRCLKTNTLSHAAVRFGIPLSPSAAPLFLNPFPPFFFFLLISVHVFPPLIMTACAIIIMRLTKLNRAQASYCAVRKFNPSINWV